VTGDPHSPGHGPTTDAAGEVALLGETAVVVLWVLLAALYLLAGRVAALRGRDGWPVTRTVCWCAGAVLGAAVTAGPLAHAAGTSFTAHTAVHLVLAMVVPVLLVLGAPVTLVLRAVPARTGRRLTGLARSAPLRVLTHPVTAGLLVTAPMAALYWDGSAFWLLHHPLTGPLVHLHFLASGALLAYAVIGTDPNPHRSAPRLRGSVIVASIAVHGVVSKHLYSIAGRPGMPPDTEQAAQLMYYGGDAAHVLLLVVFCAQVYRRSGARPERDRRGPASLGVARGDLV
jgi:putative membrane protein